MTDIEHRPVVIPKATYDVILKEDEPAGLLALYNFYYYTAVWQKTNQPKATTSYVAKGLKITEVRVRRYKKGLIKVGLIEDVRIRNKDNTRIKHHFIKVKYYTSGFQQGSKRNRVEKKEPNTYSYSSLNSYRDNTVAAKGNNGLISSKNDNISKSFDYRMSSKLYESLAKKRKIMRKVNLVAWSKQFAKFRIDNNLNKVEFKQTLIWYCKNIGGEFVPRAYAAKTFCDKYVNILDAKDPPKDKSIPQEEKYERFKVDEYGNAY